MRQVILYNIDPAKSDDFWTFRKRVYDAVVKSEAQLDMGVWTVFAGNRGLNVLVGFAHENHAEMDLDGSEEWSKVVEHQLTDNLFYPGTTFETLLCCYAILLLRIAA